MDHIRQMRKQYDPFWDIDPILARCTVVECVDILDRVNEYLQNREGWWAPRFHIDTQRMTYLELDIILREEKNDPDKIIGHVEVSRYGEGCRLTFRCSDRTQEQWYRVAYCTVDNVLHAEALAITEHYDERMRSYRSPSKDDTLRRVGHQRSKLVEAIQPLDSASREEWFEYKRKKGRKFTHKQLSVKLSLAEGYVRQLYAQWLVSQDFDGSN